MVDRTRARDDDRRSSGGRDEPRRSSREEEPRGRGRDRESDRDSDHRGGSSRGRDDDRGSSRGRDDRGGSSRGRSSGSGSSYSYSARSAEDVKKRSEGGANDFDRMFKDDVKVYKVKDGDNRLRILPPTWKDPKHFGFDIWVHYGVGPDRASYLDLYKMKGEPDPITEAMDEEKRERDPDEKYVKELTSKRRVGVWVIDRDNPKEGVQAWAMPWTLDRDIVKVSIDKQTGEVLPIDHPDDGYDIEFERKGKGDRTEYLGVAISRRSSPLGNDDWLDYAVDNPLPDMLQYFDYDHIARAFGGGGAPKSSSRDDDRREEPRRGREDDRRESPPARGRGREDDAPRGRRNEPDEPTWESVHDMTGAELEDLIDQERLDIDPRDAKDDADLADWICEEMKLEEAPKREEPVSRRRAADDEPVSRRRVADDDAPPARRGSREEPPPEDKLRDLRSRRRSD